MTQAFQLWTLFRSLLKNQMHLKNQARAIALFLVDSLKHKCLKSLRKWKKSIYKTNHFKGFSLAWLKIHLVSLKLIKKIWLVSNSKKELTKCQEIIKMKQMARRSLYINMEKIVNQRSIQFYHRKIFIKIRLRGFCPLKTKAVKWRRNSKSVQHRSR
jgi:hypothetical protein